MNLSSIVDERLWLAVRSTYEAGNYSGAILDSIYLLSDVIRDKSGLQSDGTQLVNAAFSGANPIVKVNSLHTQSDQDEQKGVHLLLMGIYSAIRNPRSHEKREDTTETADSIIHFVDYLLRVIDKARSPFDVGHIISRVIDYHFGHSEKYADLIVAKIPVRKLLEVLILVFHRRMDIPGKNLGYFVRSALKVLTDDERQAFWQIVSEALESANSDTEFRAILQIACEQWDKVSDIARLRTEHRLITSVREGEYDSGKQSILKGSIGTWARRIASKMELKDDYAIAVYSRIMTDSVSARAYGLEFHFDAMRKIKDKPWPKLIEHLNSLLAEHDQQTYNSLAFLEFDEIAAESPLWADQLRDSYKAFVPPAPDYGDIPF